MNKKKTVRPFGFRDKLGYLFGDFGNDFTFILSSSFLLKFYTDVMGIEAYIVGIVMMIARIVDAFTDVAMGRICDKSKQTPVAKFFCHIRGLCLSIYIGIIHHYGHNSAIGLIYIIVLALFAHTTLVADENVACICGTVCHLNRGRRICLTSQYRSQCCGSYHTDYQCYYSYFFKSHCIITFRILNSTIQL